MFHVAMLLSGCGMYDGTEPQEAMPFLAEVERRGGRVFCVAPDVAQLHVVDHLDGNEMEGRRSLMQEAARLGRGKIQPLGEFRPEVVDALVIPGGYGVAKNLMTGFADVESPREVVPEVAALMSHFLSSGKPMGVISLGKVLLEAVVENAFTERLRREDPGEVYEDPDRPIFYTPGFLVGNRLAEVLPGIEVLAERLLKRCEEGAA
jgi:enhancing lycopene biosynthesis protein 2